MPPPTGGQRVARPVSRYRPGKAPVPGAGDLSDSDASDHVQQEADDLQITSISQGTAALAAKRKTAGVVIDQSRQLNLNLQQKESSSEYETDSEQDEPPQKPVFRAPGRIGTIPNKKEEVKQESSEYETDSEEEEEESSEEEQRAPMLKPVFVPKRQRATLNAAETAERAAEEEERKAVALAESRRQESHRLAAERIKKELAEKEHEESKPDLDDTDGKDPETEFAEWRIRELERIKRDRQVAQEKRKEKEEIERRREMPEQERLEEDLAKAKKSRAEKQKGQQGFMQKYYHKGSFFQDMDILKRDYSEKTESAVDVSKLPKIMQVRNYGKASRSKWTHLANEDTSRLSRDLGRDGKGCFNCGGDHLRKDCPQAGASGANAAPLADPSRPARREEDRSRDDPRERRRDDSRRTRDRNDDRRRSDDRRRNDERDRHRERGSRDDRDRYRSDERSRRHRSRSPDRRD